MKKIISHLGVFLLFFAITANESSIDQQKSVTIQTKIKTTMQITMEKVKIFSAKAYKFISENSYDIKWCLAGCAGISSVFLWRYLFPNKELVAADKELTSIKEELASINKALLDDILQDLDLAKKNNKINDIKNFNQESSDKEKQNLPSNQNSFGPLNKDEKNCYYYGTTYNDVLETMRDFGFNKAKDAVRSFFENVIKNDDPENPTDQFSDFPNTYREFNEIDRDVIKKNAQNTYNYVAERSSQVCNEVANNGKKHIIDFVKSSGKEKHGWVKDLSGKQKGGSYFSNKIQLLKCWSKEKFDMVYDFFYDEATVENMKKDISEHANDIKL